MILKKNETEIRLHKSYLLFCSFSPALSPLLFLPCSFSPAPKHEILLLLMRLIPCMAIQQSHVSHIFQVTIVPRTGAALGFAQYMPSDRKLYSKEQLNEMMCVALGGRAAETIVFNRVTTGERGYENYSAYG